MTKKTPNPRAFHWGRWVLVALIVVVQLPLIHFYWIRSSPKPRVTVPFGDTFDSRDSLQNYQTFSAQWRVVEGELFSPGVRNNPLWLLGELPADVAVEFDVKSESREGDIKVEIFGNGLDHASGYVLIHGGWNNSLSVLARLDEHGAPISPQGKQIQHPRARVRVETKPFRVETGRYYHWRVERKGQTLRWAIDGQPFIELTDPFPLSGKGHDRFGFSSWESQLFFDNLKISAL